MIWGAEEIEKKMKALLQEKKPLWGKKNKIGLRKEKINLFPLQDH